MKPIKEATGNLGLYAFMKYQNDIADLQIFTFSCKEYILTMNVSHPAARASILGWLEEPKISKLGDLAYVHWTCKELLVNTMVKLQLLMALMLVS